MLFILCSRNKPGRLIKHHHYPTRVCKRLAVEKHRLPLWIQLYTSIPDSCAIYRVDGRDYRYGNSIHADNSQLFSLFPEYIPQHQ